MLGVDKEAAIFYVFLGWYPIAKWQLERLKGKQLIFLVKTALFLLATGLMYALMAFVLRMDAVLADFGEMGTAMTVVFFLMMAVCMHLYDRLLFPLLLIYEKKLKPRLRLR